MTPKIVFLDVETSPLLGYAWQTYDTNILSIVEPVKIICAAWKFLGDKRVNVQALPDYEGYVGGVVDDSRLVETLWSVLNAADVVIAHNGAAFDIKVCNARFIAHGLTSPSDYKVIDTLKVAKKNFKFSSNSLDELGKYLQEGKKLHTGGLETWLKCMAGDPVAWKRMKEYNVGDIELLERVYVRLRPFISDHPNLNLIAPRNIKKDEYACQSCQSTKTQKRGFTTTKAGRYQRYQCLSCGSWSTGPYERVRLDSRVEYDSAVE